MDKITTNSEENGKTEKIYLHNIKNVKKYKKMS